MQYIYDILTLAYCYVQNGEILKQEKKFFTFYASFLLRVRFLLLIGLIHKCLKKPIIHD